ncbi:hypothetical protein H7K38_14370 [Mycobacterium alsense]|uniref:PE-PGRS family protein n=1 Tax=Mycobacterium alsense TaxID=324058 RepID=A0AA41XR64_9MYCO|nr:hypothetical protein [Mycobacterium alsense]MCV7379832.1 hypothetical protein [Mycobacterium alsense]
MDLAARRPHITAGVALASAAVIAAGPMTQHLPKFDVAQHLPEVSVTEINLTDAANGMMDLFSGVENELASLASGGAAAAAVPAAALTDFINPAALPLPVATWVNTFQAAGTNLQTLFNQASAIPFPLAQQVAANILGYGTTEYIQPFQNAATAAVNYFTGTNKTTYFQPLIAAAMNAWATGHIQTAVTSLYRAFYYEPIFQIGEPLFPILKIPGQMMQNVTDATNWLFTTGLSSIVTSGVLQVPSTGSSALGGALQAVYNSFTSGDPIGGVTNALNIPGTVINQMLNGLSTKPGYILGLISSAPSGITTFNASPVQDFLVSYPRALASLIANKGSQNIVGGGSLATAFQTFANQLVNGWPSLSPVVNDLSAGLTSLLQNIPSVLSNLPSTLGNLAGTIATQIGSWVAWILKML